MIIDDNFLQFSFRYKFPWRQFLPIDSEFGGEIQVPVVNPHGCSVASFFLISTECFNDIGLAVICGVAKGHVSSFRFRESRFHVDVAVVINGNMPGASGQAVHDNDSFKAVGKKESTIIRIACG